MIPFLTGDSIPAYWPIETYYPEIVKKCYLGATPEQVRDQFPAILALTEPDDVVIILCGTNAPYPPPHPSINAIQQMGDMARAAQLGVILCQITPRVYSVEDFNLALIAMAQTNFFNIIDLFNPGRLQSGAQNQAYFPDGTHPNGCYYDIMTGIIRSLLNAMLTSVLSAEQILLLTEA